MHDVAALPPLEHRRIADRRHPAAALLAVTALLVSACGTADRPEPVPDVRGAAPEGPAVAASNGAAAPAAAASPTGAPQIVDSGPEKVHVQYRQYGAGEPLVVLIHGWSCDSNYWASQLDALKANFSVVTVDLAGHGGSGANRTDWSMSAFGRDVAAVVDALPQFAKVVLVGHSMGGPVAVEAARQIGPRVVGVIGVDTLRNVAAPPVPASETAARLKAFEADFIGSTRGLVTAQFFTPKSDPTLVRRIADDMSQAPPEVAIPAIRELNAWDGKTALRELQMPVTVINADLGPRTDVEASRKLAPKFNAVIVDGLGHFLMMEDPARFNPLLEAEIRKFL
jgi:pimeloyl-ACP methyl ester carboxylesterase